MGGQILFSLSTFRCSQNQMAKSMKKAGGAKKSMKRKAMKVSKIAKGKRGKSSVFRGTKEKTQGGLKKADLMKNKYGKVVTKKSHARGQKNKWAQACSKARKALGIKGFCPFGGKTAKGKALLAKARSFYKK